MDIDLPEIVAEVQEAFERYGVGEQRRLDT